MWNCTRLIDSSPPATATGAPSLMIRPAASAIACRPEEQKRFTVMADALGGMPPRNAACRAMLPPVAPSGLAQPITTSSTLAGSMPARSIAARMAWPPMSAPWVMLNAPRCAFPMGVRAVETMTASVIGVRPSWFR